MAEKENIETKSEEPVVLETKTTSSKPVSASNSGGGKRVILFIVIGLLVLCLCCCIVGFVFSLISSRNATTMMDERVQNEVTGSTGSTTQVNAPDEGQTKSAGAFVFTLVDVRTDGENYIFEVSVKNDTNRVKNFSTWLSATLSSNTQESYSQNFFYDKGDDRALDGELEAGETITGTIIYRVDDNPSKLTLSLGDFMEGEKTTFQIK